MDPVFEESGMWYFWDETWANKHGPYVSQDAARAALLDYADTI